MEQWRQCGRWLIDCKVLPPNHRVVWPSAVAFDLAQALRDGVLLCQLLHNLSPGSIDLKDINFRPQMSQVSAAGAGSPGGRALGGGRRGQSPGAGRGGGRGAGRTPGLGAGSSEGRLREARSWPKSLQRRARLRPAGTARGALRCRPRSRRRRPARVPSDPGELAAPGASTGVAGIRRRTGLAAVEDRPARRGWGAAGGPAGRGARGAEGAGGSGRRPLSASASSRSSVGRAGLRPPRHLAAGSPRAAPLGAIAARPRGGFVVAEARVVAVWWEDVCSAGRSCLSWPFEGNLAKT